MPRHPRLSALCVAALLLACLGSGASARAVQDDPHVASARTAPLDAAVPVDPAVVTGRLDNGLTYLIRRNDEPENRAELRLAVDVGSILEDEDQLGLAHFVEHMAFNGTEHFAAQELVAFMESIGMRLGPHVNAYTSFDETVYMLQLPTDDPEPLRTGFQILEDWAHGLSLEDEEIDKERGVVIEEWRLGLGAYERISNQQLPVLLHGSRYAERLPIGTRASLESASYESLRRFYRDWYRPELMSVVAVGDFDVAEVEALIRDHFEDLEGPEDPRPREAHDIPEHAETLFAIATDPELPSAAVSVEYKLPPEEQGTVGAYRRSLVETLYSRMLNERLRELLQQADPPFTFAVTGKGPLLRGRSVYRLSAGVEPTGILRGLEALLTEVERAARHGFTLPELERVKTLILRRMERTYDERDNRNSRALASEYVRAALTGEPIPGIEYELELARRFLPEIDLEEVSRVADGWRSESSRVISVSAPEREEVEVPDEAQLLATMEAVEARELAAYEEDVVDAPLIAEEPEPGEVVETEVIDEPGLTVWTLSNGVRVALMPTDFKDDEILVRAVSPGGTSVVADEDWLAATSAAQLMSVGGLGEFDQIALDRKLAGAVARSTAFISRYNEGISGVASPRDLETLMRLVHLQFTAPRADPAAFESLRSRFRTMLENQAVDPRVAFSMDLQRILSQGHPRNRPITPELLDQYDLERSLEIYRQRFADADDFVFVFVGALDLDAMRPLVERYLGSLPALEGSESWRDVGIRPPEGVIIRKFFRGVEPQSQTRINFTGPFEYDVQANRTTIRAMASVLETRLRDVLREELGGTYGVGVGAGVDWQPQGRYTISIGFASDPARAEELIEAIHEEIRTLKRDGPSEQAVADVRQNMIRSYETSSRNNNWWAAQLLYAYERGTGFDNLRRYLDTVEALAPAAIQEAARRYLDMTRYVQATLYPEMWDPETGETETGPTETDRQRRRP